MEYCAVIPSYRPDVRLIETIQSLRAVGFTHIFVVNDGSGADYDVYFEQAAAQPGVVLLRHAINMGKGRAMKTGFCAVLEQQPGCPAVVVDGDGQHPAPTAMQAVELAAAHPDALILGCRRFLHQKSMPLPNLIGNLLTRAAFFLLTGIAFSDTQCGLRAYPPAVMRRICEVSGERFELENNTLLAVRRQRIPVVEFGMEVVYAPKGSYVTTFRKAADSARIARALLDFACIPLLLGLLSALAAFCFLPAQPRPSEAGWITALAQFAGKLLLIPGARRKGAVAGYAVGVSAAYGWMMAVLLHWIGWPFSAAFGVLLVPFALISFACYRLAAYGRAPKRLVLPESPHSGE